MTIQETVELQDLILSKYGDTDTDKTIIKTLCFARNVCEMIAPYFYSTNNKAEFYRTILNDNSMTMYEGYKTLSSYYGYLKEI